MRARIGGAESGATRDATPPPPRWATRRRRDAADAVSQNDHVLKLETVALAYVPHESVDIFYQRPEIFRRSPLARGTPVTARVPGKNRNVIQPQQLDEFRPASGMLMTAMKKEQRFRRRTF